MASDDLPWLTSREPLPNALFVGTDLNNYRGQIIIDCTALVELWEKRETPINFFMMDPSEARKFADSLYRVATLAEDHMRMN